MCPCCCGHGRSLAVLMPSYLDSISLEYLHELPELHATIGVAVCLVQQILERLLCLPDVLLLHYSHNYIEEDQNTTTIQMKYIVLDI